MVGTTGAVWQPTTAAAGNKITFTFVFERKP
jgi:hypothetical protein